MRTLMLMSFFVFPLLAQESATPEGKIVAKALAATGWDKKTGDHMTWNDKGKFIEGTNTMEYTGDFHVSFPDKYRFTIRAKQGGVDLDFTVVVNGVKAWQSMGSRSEEIVKEKLEYIQNELYLMTVASLKPLLDAKQQFTLKSFDGGKVKDRACVGILVEKTGKPAIKLWFHAETGLMAKAEYKVKNEFDMWKEATDEIFYSDWAESDGVKTFKKFAIVRNGKPMLESECSDFKFPEKVDAKLYEKP